VAQQGVYDWLWRRTKDAGGLAEVLRHRRFVRGRPGWGALGFTATHDQPRLLSLVGDPRVARLAQLLVLMRADVPALLYGDEVGLASEAAERAFEDAWPDRMCLPWHEAAWDTETLEATRAAIRIRRDHDALSRGDEQVFELRGGDGDVLVVRRRHAGQVVDVVLNGSDETAIRPFPGDAPSAARTLLRLGEAEVDAETGSVRLGAWSAVVVARVAPAEVRAAWEQLRADGPAVAARAYVRGATAFAGLPTQLYLTVTERCNLRCRHCITHAPERTRAGTARTLRPWLLDSLAEALAAASYFGFSHGGESLVAPVFEQVLRSIQRARRGARGRTDVHLLTNGMRLDAETVRRLVELGVTSLAVSLDGPTAATNDPIRRGGRFERVVDNVREALRLREAEGADLRVGISTVVTASNVETLAEMGRLAVDLGIDWLKLEELFPATPFARRELVPTAACLDARETLGDLLAAHGIGFVDHLDAPSGCACEAEGNERLRRFLEADGYANRTRFHTCRAAWDRACVDPDGTVHPMAYDEPALGSLRHASMLDLWQGEQMQAVRSEALRRIPVEQRTGCPLWLPAEDRS